MLNLNEKIASFFKTINVKDLIQSRNQGEKQIRNKPFATTS
jgi:hypothetical protein